MTTQKNYSYLSVADFLNDYSGYIYGRNDGRYSVFFHLLKMERLNRLNCCMSYSKFVIQLSHEA